jgi:undecaprenyl-diphosphatase
MATWSARDVVPLRPVGSRPVVAARLVGGAVALWLVLSACGLLVTKVLSAHGPTGLDIGVDRWFAAHRTGTWNSLTLVGSGMANTQTAIAVTAVAVLFLRWRLGRWYEGWVVVAAITGELLVFLAVTATVHRDRPPVPKLDVSPPTSSFPSGHTAAAVALYWCLAFLLLHYGRPGALTRVLAGLFMLAPVAVGLSRLYRGMHFPTDVLVGAVGGALWLAVVLTTLARVRTRRSGSTEQLVPPRPAVGVVHSAQQRSGPEPLDGAYS